MRLLRIEASGLFLFKDKVVIDFNAEQRVYPDNASMLYNAFGNTYTNNVISFVGVNASGKTTTLKLISFVMSLLNAESINSIETKVILDKTNGVLLKTFFYDEKSKVCMLETEIGMDEKKEKDIEKRYIIKAEKLYTRTVSSITSKANLFDFSNDNTTLIRDASNEFMFLKDDVSIAIYFGKTGNVQYIDFTQWTDFNVLNAFGNFPVALIQFLDPSIEYIKYTHEKKEMFVKFKKDKDPIYVRGTENIRNYLSSGTIKGLNVFMLAWFMLIKGGYILVDEIENHFNKEIVASLIRFFMDEKVNKQGATLLYSTHYVELLDELDRNDNIYITTNDNGIQIQKLHYLLQRNDIKKSDVFQSGMIKGTAPSYENYLKLKKVFSTGTIVEESK